MARVFENDKCPIKMKYTLLVIGNIHDRHIGRFIQNLKMENGQAQIDVLSPYDKSYCPDNLKEYIATCFFCKTHNNILYHIPIIGVIFKIVSLISTVKSIKNKQYDIINIHFPLFHYRFIMKYLKSMSKTILVTPWGSDVYRINKIKRKLCRKVYLDATHICGTGNRFSNDVSRLFSIPKRKFVNLDIGSETLDYIYKYRDIISPQEAKYRLGIDNRYVITCGYNASKAQNHTEMINAIHEVVRDLPKNTTLLFPMTYGGSKEYINTLKDRLDKLSIPYIMYTEYLSIEQLFLLRQATDIFIHVQTSDANSATVQEYLLCKKKVINGAWLSYDELEINGEPYYVTENTNKLGRDIINAYKANNIEISEDTLTYIMSYSWKNWIVKWNDFFQKQSKERV